MKAIKKIVCPVDFSENSQAAIALATHLARLHQGKLVFVYVAPQWLTHRDVAESEFVRSAIESDRQQLSQIRPATAGVDFEHQLLFGNPGPEIVRHAQDADMIVISTHGYSGLKRFLVGSVAQYVMRYATCPVVSLKSTNLVPGKGGEPAQEASYVRQRFVTDVMHHVAPVRLTDPMSQVLAELEAARETAAPVCAPEGVCVGILTNTDIARFKAAEKESQEASLVESYYSAPVITLSENSTCQQAHQILQQHPEIHHLVVVNEAQRPLGIVESADIYTCGAESARPPVNSPGSQS